MMHATLHRPSAPSVPSAPFGSAGLVSPLGPSSPVSPSSMDGATGPARAPRGAARNAKAEAAATPEPLSPALRRLHREAQLGRLLACVAHDLNNPLTVVLGRSALLADDADRPAAVRQGAQRIADAARRCGALVQAVLGLTRTTPRPPTLAGLAGGLAEIAARGLQHEGVHLATAWAPDLPPVAGDATELAHALLALLCNAREALATLPAGAAERRITLTCGADADDPGTLWLRVQDTGPGVPRAIAGRVFEPFFSTRPDAAGLGLAFARDAARRHGGDLVLEDTAQGARFLLRWPAVAGRPADTPAH